MVPRPSARLRRSGPEAYAKTIEILDDLEMGRITFSEDRALLSGDTPERNGTMLAEFRLEDGEWRLDEAVRDSNAFKTLERKLACFLPKGLPPVVPASRYSFILRIGPGGVGEDQARSLTRLAGPPEEPIPPGITANDAPLAAALAGPLPPVPEDDPALSRVIGIRRK